MDLRKTLILGERMDVTIDKASYKSVLQDFESETILRVSQITVRTVPVFVAEGTEAQLVYFRQDSGMYFFQAVMLGYVSDGSIRLMRFEARGEPIRFQQRQSFRLNVRLPARIWYRDKQLPADAQEVELSLYTNDLSCTGIQFETDAPIAVGQQINCEISVNAETSISAFCEVRRCIEIAAGRGVAYRVGVQFMNLSARMQRHISKYIMTEQIKMHKRL